MDAQFNPVVKKTARPVVAGIFNIVVGSINILGVIGLIIAAIASVPFDNGFPLNVQAILIIIAVPLAVLGAVSIVGGVYGLQRRLWGLALAGSITSAISSTLLGIASIVLIAISKEEFV